MRRATVLLTLLFLLAAGPGPRADELPIAGPVPADQLRAHCRQLLQALDGLKSPLPAESEKELKELLKGGAEEPADFSVPVQKVLDAHCLAGLSINAESRVKAARGPAEARLRAGREAVVLVKVSNEAGVTAAVRVNGPGIRGDRPAEGEWLQAVVQSAAPGAKGLSGAKVEYVLLRLKAQEAGKREATLRFDVGQGTQDLGFRAEVPILFTVEDGR